MTERFNGKVAFFKKEGWGFLEWDKNGVKQTDIFVHYSDLDMEGFKMLQKEQLVTFGIGTNHRGQPKAVEVRAV